jgi:hypothetical protein
MQPQSGIHTIEIRADYSKTIPDPDLNLKPLTLTDQVIRNLKDLKSSLEPKKVDTEGIFVGSVADLKGRPNDNGEIEGNVVLSLNIPGRGNVKASAFLLREDYISAVEAHRDNQNIRISGTLSGDRKKMEVTGIQILK